MCLFGLSFSEYIPKSEISESCANSASLIAQLVKNLPAMQETQVGFVGQEDFLEKEMATHSSILAWRILMDRGAWDCKESDTT